MKKASSNVENKNKRENKDLRQTQESLLKMARHEYNLK